VNEARCKFVTENCVRTDKFAIGSNYLETCDTGHEQSAEGATSMSSGIRAVLRGESPSFERRGSGVLLAAYATDLR
jgi:hypothetical protein